MNEKHPYLSTYHWNKRGRHYSTKFRVTITSKFELFNPLCRFMNWFLTISRFKLGCNDAVVGSNIVVWLGTF